MVIKSKMGGTHNMPDIGWETLKEKPFAEPRHT